MISTFFDGVIDDVNPEDILTSLAPCQLKIDYVKGMHDVMVINLNYDIILS